jgi:2-oxoisovalerate dehydrogenase E2 component (dihydrolipoyl transacylase)
LASPAVRARAKALGIDLAGLAGTGPEGRVLHADLDRLLKPRRTAFEPPPAGEAVEAVKLVGVRRGIAERMEAAWRIPHMGYVEEIDLTALAALRERLNAGAGERPRLALLPFLMAALARVLPEHPQINARFDDEAGVLHRYRAVHVGVATDTPEGLLVPVVRDVQDRDLWSCAAEVSRLAAAARERRLSRGELSGSTVTVTSLGRLGGVLASPIINWPEVAILAPGRARLRPAMKGERVVGRTLMNLSTAFDHRVIDGREAAEFVSKIKRLLENPEGLLG